MYLFFVNKSLKKKKKKREKARSWRNSSKSVKCWLYRDVIIKKSFFFKISEHMVNDAEQEQGNGNFKKSYQKKLHGKKFIELIV